ncbi:MAG: hypothetical protein II213_02915 [Lachnospiraceae bacterium]|nr:hypothetical protein [Lachnospiraceae bacterium]
MLVSLVLGTIGFILFFLYDINSFTIKNRFVESFFFLGCAFVVVPSGYQFYVACSNGEIMLPNDLGWLILAGVALSVLVYCLFFAIPFEKTYVNPQEGRSVYDGGVYALCRHPGVVCFFVFYLFLGIAVRPYPFLPYGMYLSVLNLLYVVFQDAVTFPKTFCDYTDYKKYTPFIIPTKKSVCRSVSTMKRESRKENIQ